MGGKVFAESSNIYQDEAKILFDYYKKAAEAIVAEEKRIEGEIAQKDRNIADLKEQGEKIKRNKTLMLVLAAAGGVIGLVMLIAQFIADKNLLYGIPGFLLGIVGVILFLARLSELKRIDKMIPEQQKQIDELTKKVRRLDR